MRFLIDENLPRRLAVWLRAAGHDATHVSEAGLLGASDTAIWSAARDAGAIVVTRDTDFNARAEAGQEGQVLLVATGNIANDALLQRVSAAWAAAEVQLASGARLVELR